MRHGGTFIKPLDVLDDVSGKVSGVVLRGTSPGKDPGEGLWGKSQDEVSWASLRYRTLEELLNRGLRIRL